jgi:putative endonuclease
MARTHDLGRRGEDIAARFLAHRGWTVLARNFRLSRREVDLVVRRGRVVAFVEVKTRAGRACGHPLEAIGPGKRREIQAVAAAWVDRHGRPGDTYRFDAVAVTCRHGSPPEIEHVPDAWRL